MKRVSLIVLLSSLLAFFALAASVGARAVASFETGTYSGTTSQGHPFSFVVTNTGCAALKEKAPCLYTATQAYLFLPCHHAPATNTYAEPSGPVPANGNFRDTTTLFSKVVSVIKLTHTGSASGYFNAANLPADGCATPGNVTFTAKLTHRSS